MTNHQDKCPCLACEIDRHDCGAPPRYHRLLYDEAGLVTGWHCTNCGTVFIVHDLAEQKRLTGLLDRRALNIPVKLNQPQYHKVYTN